MTDYAFCERVNATPWSKWHIRPLTEQGRKMGGGIDTLSLCGVVKQGWDLEMEITPSNVARDHICAECRRLYLEQQ